MSFVRRYLVLVAGGFLAIQVALVAAAPAVLWQVSAAHGDQECDCPLDAGATCPMHHRISSGDTACKLRNAFGASDQALSVLTGGAGVLPASTASVSAFDPGAPVRTPSFIAVSRVSVPDAPPPRS